MKAKGEPGKRLCIFETDINNDPFERETESPRGRLTRPKTIGWRQPGLSQHGR
jgi:hypothetical protein